MNKRNINYIKQLKSSFIYKILALISSFLLVRYTLEYLGLEVYGLWSVILTFINWMVFFDFGITNGIKNQVAKCLSDNKYTEAQEYISTGYVTLAFFAILIYVLVLVSSFFVNWQFIFNITFYTNNYLQYVILISSFFILLNFVLAIIGAIFNATQNASLIVINQFYSQVISLSIVYCLNIFVETSLIYIAISYGLSLMIVNISISFWFYKKNKSLKPLIHYYRKDKVKSILKLGIKFFILQITVLVIMSSDRMIAIQLLDLKDVTTYDLLFKYFSIVMIFHSLINGPLWSMYTEAYKKQDYFWIKKILKKLNLLFLLYIIIIIIMVFMGDTLILLWTGNEKINITNSNYFFMAIVSLSLIWTTIYAYFLNGIEELNIQLITTVIAAIINIPLSIFLAQTMGMGLNGILLATTICLSFFNIAGTIQTYYIIRKWNKHD